MSAPELFPSGVRFEVAAIADAPLHADEEPLAREMSPARRREFAAGRACARRALAALGAPAGPIGRGERRMPLWPEGVVGSITHGGGTCAAAVARREAFAGLGLDTEPATPLSERVLARITTEAERAALAALSGHAPTLWGKVVFSAKESLYKAYFPLVGAFLAFRDVEVSLDPARGEFRARLVRADAPDAAGRRAFTGRFALDAERVWTALAISAA